MKKIIILSMLCTMLLLGDVFAQGIGIGPFLGYQKAKDADEGSLFGGGGVRIHLSDALAIEGAILYRSEKFGEITTVKSWPIMASALYYPIPVAYGLIGAGWYNTTIEYDLDILQALNIDTKTTSQEFGWHFGGGVELPVGNNLKLTADIRYVFIDYEFEEVPGSDDIDSDFYMVNIGLLFGL